MFKRMATVAIGLAVGLAMIGCASTGDTVENKVEDRTNQEVESGIDRAFDSAVDR